MCYKVIFETDMDLCYAAFLGVAFEIVTDLLNNCFLAFPLYSDPQNIRDLMHKSSMEMVDPVPMVNFALLFVDTV